MSRRTPRPRVVVALLAVFAMVAGVLGADARSTSSSEAATPTRTVKVSWQIVADDRSIGAGCSVTAYLQVGAVPGAISYAVTIVDSATGTYHLSGPPFNGDKVDVAGQIVRAPAGTHRWGLSSYGENTRGEGCANAKAGFLSGKRWKVTSATATVAGKPEDEEAPGTISGRAFETDCGATGGCTRKGLPGVTITATGPGGTARTTTKGPDGAYSLKVDKGTYKVTPTLGDREFDPPTDTVSVSANGNATASFRTCALARTTQSARVPARATDQLCSGPDGLDWSVPDRVENQVKRWLDIQLLNLADVYPSYWPVELFLTSKGGLYTDCNAKDWTWKVTPPTGAKVTKEPEIGCAPTMKVSELGTYKVEVTGMVNGKNKTFTKNVVVKDWVIIGMGDSNGSGEGNAPFQVERCNRGDKSYQYLTAKYVEEQDPHTSVTFLFASCSGAGVENIVAQPYRGVRKKDPPLDPQIDQITWLLAHGPEGQAGEKKTPRKIDAAIISAGVNNLAFGPLMEVCVVSAGLKPQLIADTVSKLANGTCIDWPVTLFEDDKGQHFHWPIDLKLNPNNIGTDNYVLAAKPSQVYKDWLKGKGQTVEQLINGLIHDLPNSYGGLAKRVAKPIEVRNGGLGITDPSRVFLTQYPDFTSDADGHLCNSKANGSFPNWDGEVWGFIRRAGAGLNSDIAKAAAMHHFSTINIPVSAWRGHGYCAGAETWFTSLFKGVSPQSFLFNPELMNKDGAFHPNVLGHQQSSRYARAEVCAKLYKKPDCTGEPRG